MTQSAEVPTDRMKALYHHHVALYGEPTDLIWFDPAKAAKKSHFAQLHVCVWAADEDCEVTTLTTLGMSEKEMVGPGVTRVELHFAIRAELSDEETHSVARFLANLAEYPFDHNLHLDWWQRLADVGVIPGFPGKHRILIRPPFTDDACREVTYDEQTIRFLYLVPLTSEENRILAEEGISSYVDYLVRNELDPLGQM